MHSPTVRVPQALLAIALVVCHAANAQPTPPRAPLKEDLRLDANAEDFPRVRFVYVGPHGEIVVPIASDAQLRIYDSTGKRTAIVGRRGGGPGEFRDIYPVGWKADTMWASDQSQRRVSYFGPDLKLIRTTPNEAFDRGPSAEDRAVASRSGVNMPLSSLSVMGVLPGGDIVAYANGWSPNAGHDPAQAAFGVAASIVRVTPGSAPRALFVLPWGGDSRWGMAAGGNGRTVPFMFAPQTVVSETGDRVVHLWSEITSRSGGAFTVSAFRSNGDTMFVRTFPFTGVPIPSSARDSAISALVPRGGASEGGGDVSREFQDIARKKIPSVYAGVESLLPGLDNTVWIGLHTTPEGQPVLVLNAKGDPVASILVPPKSRLVQASATHVYMTEKDDDGLVSVVRYRVTGIACGAPGCR